MGVSKKALWFGWFEQNLTPPREPDFMRERRERQAAQRAKSTTAKSANGKNRTA